MKLRKNDVGYILYSRLEESLRAWIGAQLLTLYGCDWCSNIPQGIFEKVEEKQSSIFKIPDEPENFLEKLDMPDLMEIVCYKNAFPNFISPEIMPIDEFRDKINTIYKLRCKIAHVSSEFSDIDFELLKVYSESLLPILGEYGNDLKEILSDFEFDQEYPEVFEVDELSGKKSSEGYFHNTPELDYDSEGGFIGRKEDLKKIKKLVLSNLFRVVTILGVGGVGKTAIVHKICKDLISKPDLSFNAIIWVSAKNEKLTFEGIEPIEPTLQNYESLIDCILETYGFHDQQEKTIKEKEKIVNKIIKEGYRNLFVIDNLEINIDPRIKEFIINLPNPNKVLITSRTGLGEVEKIYILDKMKKMDAVFLIRTLAKEKGANHIIKLQDSVLANYVNRMSGNPLVIKWVIGQVALGSDINHVINKIYSPTGDVARFCFEKIYNEFLNTDLRMVLYSLAAWHKPSNIGILSYISGLSCEQLDTLINQLTKASLINLTYKTYEKSENETVESRYEILELTRNYIYSKLLDNPEIFNKISNRIGKNQSPLLDEQKRRGKKDRYHLFDLETEIEEERFAALSAISAFKKYQTGDYAGATEGFKKAVKIAPYFPFVYKLWSVMENKEKLFDKSDMLIMKATNLDPNDDRLWFWWAKMEKERGRYTRACYYLKNALSLKANEARILGALGDVEKRRGNYERADNLFREALKSNISGSEKRTKIILFTDISDNLQRWAKSLFWERESNKALKKLDEALPFALNASELSGNDKKTRTNLKRISGELAVQLLRSGHIDTAESHCKISITECPRDNAEKSINIRACYYYSIALINHGRFKDAKKYYLLGKKSLFSDSPFQSKYEQLKDIIFQPRQNGKVIKIDSQRGIGIIRTQSPVEQYISMDISDFTPKISKEQFKKLEDSVLSFQVEKTESGIKAKRIQIIKKKNLDMS